LARPRGFESGDGRNFNIRIAFDPALQALCKFAQFHQEAPWCCLPSAAADFAGKLTACVVLVAIVARRLKTFATNPGHSAIDAVYTYRPAPGNLLQRK
jgi:hypothetical protein